MLSRVDVLRKCGLICAELVMRGSWFKDGYFACLWKTIPGVTLATK